MDLKDVSPDVVDRIRGAVSVFIVGYGNPGNPGTMNLVQKQIDVQRTRLPEDECYSEGVRQYIRTLCDEWESRDEYDKGVYRRNYECLRKLYS